MKESLLKFLFEKIGTNPWMIFTALFCITFAFVGIDGGKAVSPWTYGLLAFFIVGTVAGHFCGRAFQSRTKIQVFEKGRLNEIIFSETENFKGEIEIFNIELNTFDQQELWKRLIEPIGITEVRIFLPAHIFLRLEKKFDDYPDTTAIFLAAKEKIKIIVYPVVNESDREWEQMAFALFHPPVVTEKPNCLILPKVSPFSNLCPNSGVWQYVFFLHAHSPLLVDACRKKLEAIKNVAANTAFSVDEIVRFNKGEPIPIADIFEQHNENDKKAKFTEAVKRDSDGQFLPKLVGNTLHIESKIRKMEVKFVNLEPQETIKPLLLWLPPWGVPGWMKFTESMDKELGDHYRVAHVHISENSDKYTFTGAKLDAEEAIKQIGAFNSLLKIEPNKIVLVGVSVGAFVAAEIAKSMDSIKSVCLLMPAVDLFDALDSFRSTGQPASADKPAISPIELFTRKFYLAKNGFKASQLNYHQQSYFEGWMTAYHLYDLAFRGASFCNAKFFRENIQQFNKAGGKTCIGYSKQDSMIKNETMSEMSDLFKRMKCTVENIEWFHDVQAGVRFYSQAKPTRGKSPQMQPGIENVVDWLKNEALTSTK